jgi:signal transduction histidine kinase
MTLAAASLERRLIVRLSAFLLASLLLFAVVYTFVNRSDAHFHATEEVGTLAQRMALTIHVQAGGRLAFDPAAVAGETKRFNGTTFAAIDLDRQQDVAGSSPALLARLRGRPDAQSSGAELTDTAAGLEVLAMERVDAGGRHLRVAASRTMDHADIAWLGLVHEYSEEILPVFVPVMLVATLVTWLTIRLNMRPLRVASREAASISVDTPGQRMSTAGMVSEIVPMVRAVNAALGRLEAGIQVQRRFTANAAHELRTPLAVLRARVDSLAPGAERSTLVRDIDRLTRAVSQMLLSAQLKSRQIGPVEPVALAPLVRDVLADIAPLAHASGRDLVLKTNGKPRVIGSAPALESAIRNLVENALRHSPQGEAVLVHVGPGGVVVVEDRGPGVPPADRQHIFEPFWRSSGQRGDGAGLGLAIVRDVAELHRGSIEVEDAPGGGARFVLTLGDQPTPLVRVALPHAISLRPCKEGGGSAPRPRRAGPGPIT